MLSLHETHLLLSVCVCLFFCRAYIMLSSAELLNRLNGAYSQALCVLSIHSLSGHNQHQLKYQVHVCFVCCCPLHCLQKSCVQVGRVSARFKIFASTRVERSKNSISMVTPVK